MSMTEELVHKRNTCRVCAALLQDSVIDFEDLPVAGAYVSRDAPLPDPVFPLSLAQCSECGLLQLRESLAPSFYREYSFMSGVATGYQGYLRMLSLQLAEKLKPGSRVLEIGCSDGTLLEFLRDTGMQVAGFEPARQPALAAREKFLAVVNGFFNSETAGQCGFNKVDLVIIRHVLEHIDDFDAIFAGLTPLITQETILLIEVPDLTSTIEKSLYSNIYHIHSCYFDVQTMSSLLGRHGWTSAGSAVVDIFGGSLLLWAGRSATAAAGLFSFKNITNRSARSVENGELTEFVRGWKKNAAVTHGFFESLREQGAHVAGYGAAERTVSLMGMAGLNATHISAIYDRNPNLIGRALPGSRVPIQNPDDILADNPEYLVIFAQSFEDEIIRQQTAFRAAGGRFISLKPGEPAILN